MYLLNTYNYLCIHICLYIQLSIYSIIVTCIFIYFINILYFVGQSKPRSICEQQHSDNELRINTYTPWGTNVYQLEKQCKNKDILRIINVQNCSNFIPHPEKFSQFLILINNLAMQNKDDNLWYVRLGSVSTELNNKDGVSYVDRLVFENSTWSPRVFDNNKDLLIQNDIYLSKINIKKASPLKPRVTDPKNSKKKIKRVSEGRTWASQFLKICNFYNVLKIANTDCVDLLEEIKEQG